MKQVRLTFFLAIISFFSQGFTLARQDHADEIIGLYWSPKKDAKIEIYLKDEHYFGKFVWAATPRKDIKNPARALQSRDIVGLEFLTGFSCEDGVYKNGRYMIPKPVTHTHAK